jgi:type II secretory pathway pseudopilin PulG
MQAGFTLVETLAAITLIMVAIVAPMGLTVQSLSVAYYARDQITASNLAQEGIEIVRSMRDANVLSTSEGTPFNIFYGIPIGTSQYQAPFEVDGTQTNSSFIIISCGGSPCGTLLTNGQLYGYNHGGNPGYSASNFTRSLYACYVQSGGGCNNTASDEVRLVVVVSWQTAAYRSQQITLTENLFNWVNPGSGV